MYEKLATFYDTFMNDVPYDKWTEYLASFLSNKKSGVDVGCGSGKFTINLLKRGYHITGCDISAEMLSKAYENAQKEGVKATFSLQSALSFKTARPIDFVLASCDVVNYLANPLGFFKSAYKALKDDGVLIFDISSEYKLKNILANNVFTESTPFVTYIWENFLSKNCVDMRLTFFEKTTEDLYSKSTEEQTQYIFTQEKLTEMLTAVGFNKIEKYGFLSKSAPQKNEERIHFVAYKGVQND